MSNILIVDDEEQIRNLLARYLEMNGHNCTVASNAGEARRIIQDRTFELILCDVNMPGESGIDFIRYALSRYPDTAAVMVTALDDPAFAEAALEIGAYGYIIKPFKPNEILINVANALKRRKLEIQSRSYRQELERTVQARTKALRLALKNVQRSVEGIIHAMALAIETRDPYTAGHQARVTKLAMSIGKKLQLPSKQIEGIRMAGMIHDVGKIAVPAEILSKPGGLSDIEFSLIKTHPTIGYHILKDIDFPYPVAQIVLQHHERLDGSGYPGGISREEILVQAKIIAVADVVEAMASHRPYRPSLGLEKALLEINDKKGILYDPEIAEICINLFKDNGFSFK